MTPKDIQKLSKELNNLSPEENFTLIFTVFFCLYLHRYDIESFENF